MNEFNTCQIHWKNDDLIEALHFQLNDSYFQSLLTPFYHSMVYFWGVKNLEFEKDNPKEISIKKGEFIFQDSTYALLDDNSVCLSRSIDEHTCGNKDVKIYIGIKKDRNIANSIKRYNSNSEIKNPKTRFVSLPQNAASANNNMEEKVYVLHHFLEIIFDYEKANKEDEYELIPVAVCEVQDGGIIKYKKYCPPVLHICENDSFLLYECIDKIVKLFQNKIIKLEDEKKERWFQYSEFYKTNIYYFLFLNLLKRYLTIIEHSIASEKHHPWNMYGILKTFTHEMSTFDTNMNIKNLPNYNHSDILMCFNKMYDMISESLQKVYHASVDQSLKNISDIYFRHIDKIIQITQEKIDDLEQYKNNGGILSCDFSTTNVNRFMLLNLLNRYLPLLEHSYKVDKVRPLSMYGILKEYICVLTTFTTSVHVNELPDYQDSEIERCFYQAYSIVFKILNNICFTAWIDLKKELNSYFYTNTKEIKSENYDKGEIFEIVLKTETKSEYMPKENINYFFKIASQKDIDNYLTVPGKIELEYIYDEKQKDNFYLYFYRILYKDSDIWDDIKRNLNIAFQWSDAPEDLEVKFRIIGN